MDEAIVKPRCKYCGDVIGVYEPLVALVDGELQEVSRAVRRDGELVGDAYYHRDCFARHRHT